MSVSCLQQRKGSLNEAYKKTPRNNLQIQCQNICYIKRTLQLSILKLEQSKNTINLSQKFAIKFFFYNFWSTQLLGKTSFWKHKTMMIISLNIDRLKVTLIKYTKKKNEKNLLTLVIRDPFHVVYFVRVIEKCGLRLCFWLKRYTIDCFTGIDRMTQCLFCNV